VNNNKQVLILLTAVFIIGCSAIKEAGRGVEGISTQVLEEHRKGAIIKIFDFDYNTCYAKIKDFLMRRGSYIYTEDARKRLIAVYVSGEDTTPVGLFFKEISPASTQVEISSASTYAKEFIANKVSRVFGQGEDLEGEKGQDDEK